MLSHGAKRQSTGACFFLRAHRQKDRAGTNFDAAFNYDHHLRCVDAPGMGERRASVSVSSIHRSECSARIVAHERVSTLRLNVTVIS
jgi:hypothetical protein